MVARPGMRSAAVAKETVLVGILAAITIVHRQAGASSTRMTAFRDMR